MHSAKASASSGFPQAACAGSSSTFAESRRDTKMISPPTGAPFKQRALLTAAGLVIALLALAAFAAAYIGAFHDPTPHHVPIGVINARTAAAVDASHGAFSAHREPTLAALSHD